MNARVTVLLEMQSNMLNKIKAHPVLNLTLRLASIILIGALVMVGMKAVEWLIPNQPVIIKVIDHACD